MVMIGFRVPGNRGRVRASHSPVFITDFCHGARKVGIIRALQQREGGAFSRDWRAGLGPIPPAGSVSVDGFHRLAVHDFILIGRRGQHRMIWYFAVWPSGKVMVIDVLRTGVLCSEPGMGSSPSWPSTAAQCQE